MAGEWTCKRICEIANVTDYVANGSFESLRNNVKYQSTPDYAVLVRLVDHNAGWAGDFVYVDKASYEFLRKSVLVPGDIVIANVGANAGTVFRVPNLGTRMTLGPNAVLCKPIDDNALRRDFLYYYLTSNLGQESLLSIRSGSAQPKFNKTDLRRLLVPVPPRSEQRAIAHILGTLDDKIELNRRRNQTLEAMARALFKDWFVDFGPVRAKMERRDPYLPSEIWELFPARLGDEGKPEGWETKRVSDYLSLAYGKSLPAGKRHQGGVPVYGSGGITGFHNESLVNGPAVIVGRKGTVGSVYWEDSPCFPIDTVFYVQPEAPLSFCYYLLEGLPLRDMNTDAAVPGLNRENVYRLEVPASPTALIAAFAATAARFRETIAAVSGESETLTHLRDTLLPKLIAGELRIANAEEFLENLP